ncbi:replication initiator [Streptomyces sp. NPDC091281]|uniref:replication initiator n=1 Tax=Streptomyces sp. NPDC091281 TaxID=3365985 RepID=UPI003823C45D
MVPHTRALVTKGTDETGAGTDHKVTTRDDIDTAPVSRHVRTLMHTCWRLGGLPEYAPLRLRTWTHTLGYRGHILTKSRVYSTTYAALRAERAHHVGHTDIPDAITDAHWRYVGSATRRAPLSSLSESLKTSRSLGDSVQKPANRGVGSITPLPKPEPTNDEAMSLIDSEIVIVGEDGAEEPFDPAAWTKPPPSDAGKAASFLCGLGSEGLREVVLSDHESLAYVLRDQ